MILGEKCKHSKKHSKTQKTQGEKQTLKKQGRGQKEGMCTIKKQGRDQKEGMGTIKKQGRDQKEGMGSWGPGQEEGQELGTSGSQGPYYRKDNEAWGRAMKTTVGPGKSQEGGAG
jgi:hypothetical protein